MIKRALLTVLLIVVFASGPAKAADWFVDAHVVVVVADNLPSAVPFQIDLAGGSCAAFTFLVYNAANPDQAKGLFAMLLAAKLSGRTARFYGNNAGCVVTNVHFGG
jgi:hypothetical protein